MKRAMWIAPMVVLIGLAGCGGGVGVSYYATVAPPALRVEAFGPIPAPGMVWVNGYWNWTGGTYVWVGGGWQRPPRAGAMWIEPRWEKVHGRYRLRPGRWR